MVADLLLCKPTVGFLSDFTYCFQPDQDINGNAMLFIIWGLGTIFFLLPEFKRSVFWVALCVLPVLYFVTWCMEKEVILHFQTAGKQITVIQNFGFHVFTCILSHPEHLFNMESKSHCQNLGEWTPHLGLYN